MKNNFFKKVFYFFAFFTFSFTAIAQEDDAAIPAEQEVVINMDFNKSLYENNVGNMFMSNAPKAVLMAMYIPQSFEELKTAMEQDAGNEVQNAKSGEFTEAGIKYGFFTGMVKEGGEEIIMNVIFKKSDDESCIMITSMYETAVKAKYEGEAKKAIISAKIVE